MARASDDFYPRDPASFKPHIGACAYIGFFMSALVQPDWDMFQRCAACNCPACPDNSRVVSKQPHLARSYQNVPLQL